MPVDYPTGGMAIAGLLDGILQAQLRKRQFQIQDQELGMKERATSLQERTQREAQARLREQFEHTKEFDRERLELGKQTRLEDLQREEQQRQEGFAREDRLAEEAPRRRLEETLNTTQATLSLNRKIRADAVERGVITSEEAKMLEKADLGIQPPKAGAAASTPTEMIKQQKSVATILKGADVIEGESLAELESVYPNITKRMAKLMAQDPTMTAETAKDEVKSDDHWGYIQQQPLLQEEMKGRESVPLFNPEEVNDMIAEMFPQNPTEFDEEGLFASYIDIVKGMTFDGHDVMAIQAVLEKLIQGRENRLYESKVEAGTVIPEEQQMFTTPRSRVARNIP